MVLAALTHDGLAALKFASAELQADQEVVLAAVTQEGRSLRYASVELREDQDFMRLVSQLDEQNYLECKRAML